MDIMCVDQITALPCTDVSWRHRKTCPRLPFSNKGKYDRHVRCPPTLYLLSFIPMTRIKRGKMNVISFYISVLNALRWLWNPHISNPSSPPQKV